ncbi:MAG: class I SAM-dependent methyltransferase [Bifidobacteriaceae bacterium]|jgi:SAM-dependent methyltransferase|nr:class I SAM-dependent methyltransferase [Bifidobacteriaceae bacterium]
MDYYLHGHGQAVSQAHAGRNVVNSAAHLEPYLRPGLRVLDAGSAGGALTKDLARRVAPGQVTGIDLSAEAIQAAQDDPSRPTNLRYQVADIYDLPFAAGSFDLVHIHQVLHHLTDPVAALRQAARVVAPGGLISLREGDFGAAFWYPASRAWETWRDTLLTVAAAGQTDLCGGRRLLSWLNLAGLAGSAGPARTAGSAGSASSGGPGVSGQTEPIISGSLWTYPGLEPVSQIAASWAERLVDERFMERAEEVGVAQPALLRATAQGLIEWSRLPGATFVMPHLEAIVQC